ncbi:MAG: glycosyltransferase family 1 protein [Candidatus Moranbacteria bacterium]|nr:glycosyltransferase family 1 protein [Candidatus Moranbacteria bacterium]
MKIAINAADLDHARIDGTRVYISNLLKNFGLLDEKGRFLIYHKKNNFNLELEFPRFSNYEIKKIAFPFWWTQTAFALEILRKKPDVLWMPMHSLPALRSKKTKTVVTIHDLAFKFFPNHFEKKDLRRLNFFTDFAVNHADKLIAISQSTKDDILRFYPNVNAEKIKVIYHGYDKDLFRENISLEKIEEVKKKYGMNFEKYIIFAGAIQPRKNIGKLLEAFEIIKKQKQWENLGLVIAGAPGWLAGPIVAEMEKTPGAVMTGHFSTKDLPSLLAGAELFALPSLYEGFGLPVLEAMACGTPVAVANNSSLREITEGFGELFDPQDAQDMAEKILEILQNKELKEGLIKKGLDRAGQFSWEKCAKETLEWFAG